MKYNLRQKSLTGAPKLSRPKFPGVASFTLIAITIGWAFFLVDIDGNIAALTAASASFNLYRDDPGFLISVGLVASYTISLFSAWLISRYPFIFIGIWIFSLAVSEARIPILQQVMLLFRYFMMLSIISYGALGVLIQLNKPWAPFQLTGLFLLFIVSMHLIADNFKSEAVLIFPMQLAMFIGLFFGFYLAVQKNNDLKKICSTLAVVGIVMTLINLLAFKFAVEPIQQGRYRSWYELATGFANNYVLLFLPILWLFIDTKLLILKCFLLIIIGAGLYMLVLSGSRNALLTLILALFLMCAFWQPKYIIYLALIACFLTAGMYLSGGNLLNFGEAGARLGEVSDKETRYTVWSLAWTYIKSHPWWGYGLSTSLADLSTGLPTWEKFDAHNAYLGIWLRQGLIGLAGYLVIYLLALYRGIKLLFKSKNKYTRNGLILFFSICASLLLAGLFEENLSSRGSVQQALWAISVVLIFSIYRNEKKHSRTYASAT